MDTVYISKYNDDFAMRLLFVSLGCFVACGLANAQVLFDATKAEMAGNADWVIDADLYNLGVSTAAMGSGLVGAGTEANPQRIPTPGYGSITNASPETTWKGGLSAWGISLLKAGYKPETLSYNKKITYGDSSNAQDLSHYKMYVVCEPNILFTAAEKKAILNYVYDGGSLFMIADHTSSDRNNDGKDSLQVWNDLLTNNGSVINPFGITFNSDSVTPASPFADPAATNLRTHGSYGTVTNFSYASGCTMTVNTTANRNATADVWSSSAKSSSSVMFATSTYGFGRIAAAGDSSPFDDGTGDPSDTLFNGWDATTDKQLIMNTSMWLLNHPADGVPEPASFIVISLGLCALIVRRRR
jgi:hypothetical protein